MPLTAAGNNITIAMVLYVSSRIIFHMHVLQLLQEESCCQRQHNTLSSAVFGTLLHAGAGGGLAPFREEQHKCCSCL